MYGPVISVNRPVRLPACGGDPHAGAVWEGELEAPLYPIGTLIRHFSRLTVSASHGWSSISRTCRETGWIDYCRAMAMRIASSGETR
jgi:hypothetical protein